MKPVNCTSGTVEFLLPGDMRVSIARANLVKYSKLFADMDACNALHSVMEWGPDTDWPQLTDIVVFCFTEFADPWGRGGEWFGLEQLFQDLEPFLPTEALIHSVDQCLSKQLLFVQSSEINRDSKTRGYNVLPDSKTTEWGLSPDQSSDAMLLLLRAFEKDAPVMKKYKLAKTWNWYTRHFAPLMKSVPSVQYAHMVKGDAVRMLLDAACSGNTAAAVTWSIPEPSPVKDPDDELLARVPAPSRDSYGMFLQRFI